MGDYCIRPSLTLFPLDLFIHFPLMPRFDALFISLMPPFDALNQQSLIRPHNVGCVLYTSPSGQGDMYTIDCAMFPVLELCVLHVFD